jgi:hypothetical protein
MKTTETQALAVEAVNAHGAYTYLLNGAEAEISETWSVMRQPDGSRRIQSARSAPAFGSLIEVDAREQAGQIVAFDVRWQNSSPGAVPEASASYTISKSQIAARVSTFHFLLPAPPGLVVSPLLRIFQGPAIRSVAELGQGERAPVLVPWIHDPADGERLLTPLIDWRSASRLGAASVVLDGQARAADRYAYIGGRYDDTAEFFLADDGMLLRYVFRESEDKIWDVRLVSA